MAEELAKRRARPVKKPAGPAVLIIEPRGASRKPASKKKVAAKKKPARTNRKKKSRVARRGK
jgi:hypothetical protein